MLKIQCPLDQVNRQFKTSLQNELWGSDFTFVSTSRGFVHEAFVIVIDTFANRIVDWKAPTIQDTLFVSAALERATHADRLDRKVTHHSDRGPQYRSIKYSESLVDAGLEPSAVSVGDRFENAMAQTIIDLFQTEAINRLTVGDPAHRICGANRLPVVADT